jgi:lysophospholipase L1-like esterase
MSPRLRSLWKNLALAGVSLLLTLAGLEAAARTLHLGSGGFWEPHPLYGWRNIPGASGWESCYGNCAVPVTINRLGLRDREIGYETPDGHRRIVFLGDSMTAALQVPLEETFVKLLEQQLNAAGPQGSWEVLNAAVNGYGTDNELLFFQHEARKYEPEYVILAIYLANDVYENSHNLELARGSTGPKPYFLLDDEGRLQLQNFPVPETDSVTVRLGTFLKKHFQLPRFAAEALRLRAQVPSFLQPIVRLLGGARGSPPAERGTADRDRGGDICDPVYSAEIQEAWAITRALILQLRDEVGADGARLAVLAIPASPQIAPPAEGADWYCDRANEVLDGFLEEQGIPYLDMLAPFREHMLAGGEPLYYTRDFHMNAAGQGLSGRLLYRFVVDGLLES